MTRFAYFRLICAAALCLAAIGLGSAIRLPALAAAEYRQLVTPMVSSTCSSTSACLKETNGSSGSGIEGISKKGPGTIGQTSFKSTSASNGKAGVLGQDLSTSGAFDSGVMGTSSYGTGVQGTSINGSGVVAKSIGQSALFAESSADGIQSVSLSNDGTNSSTQNDSSISSGRSGVWGHDDSTDGGQLNVGVAGSSTNGIGVSASSANFVGLNVFGGGYNSAATNAFGALSIVDNSALTSPILIAACSSSTDNPCGFYSGSEVLILDTFGDLRISGTLQTSGSCSSGCINRPGLAGRRVVSYAPREAQPTMEDVGEAQLVGGRAYVRLEPKYASVIDRTGRYFVFITPEGESNQLYVTGKTAGGFAVREAHNGSSTVLFQYRIVARPYGDTSARLPDAITRETARRVGRNPSQR